MGSSGTAVLQKSCMFLSYIWKSIGFLMKFKILCVLLLSGLTACAQIPPKEEVEKIEESAEQDDISQLNLPKQELTAPILFDFLVVVFVIFIILLIINEI